MYARNMEHLIIYTALGFAHDIQLINHLVYAKNPKKIKQSIFASRFFGSDLTKFDDIPILILIRILNLVNFPSITIFSQDKKRVFPGFSKVFRIQKIWRSRFAVREKASIEGRLSFDPPQRANSVALGQAGENPIVIAVFCWEIEDCYLGG